jgi:uncharacterized protein (DUF2249 family)
MSQDSSNEAVIGAIRAHHAQLAGQLHSRTDAVATAARTGECAREHDALRHWYRTDLMPHIVAEEQALYRPASELEATRLLIRGMLAEHLFLVSLVADLAMASDPFQVASTAIASQAVFTVHLSKENDLLLPALDQAGLNLSAILDGMHEILGHQDDDATVDGNLDVRALPHGQRHEIIFARLGSLAPGKALVIVNDHDPKPLRYQTSAMWPDRFEWTYQQAGPAVWRVAISRAG